MLVLHRKAKLFSSLIDDKSLLSCFEISNYTLVFISGKCTHEESEATELEIYLINNTSELYTRDKGTKK